MVEKFFIKIIKTKFIDFYVATAFFATVVFFILNISLYTPSEILMWIIIVTLTFKGLAHLIVSIIIMFFDLKQIEQNLEYKKQLNKLETLVNELSIQQTKIKNKNNKQKSGENK